MHVRFLSLSIVVLALGGFFVFVVPFTEASYLPGATLDPSCFPTDPTCIVTSLTASGTVGQIPYYASAGNVLSATSTVTILQNGNVGIGTTSPYTKLSISGAAGGLSDLFAVSSSTSNYATSTVLRLDSNGNLFLPGGNSINIGDNSITTIRGDTATSTFAGDVNVPSGYCYQVNGTCIEDSLTGNVITLGAGGQVQTLAAAITARNAIPNVLLVNAYNASITGTAGGTIDQRYLVADSGAPLSSIVGIKGDVGVQIDGPGNPIIRANVINGTTLELHAPIPEDFISVSVTVYDIVPVAIVLLPGTHIRYDPSVNGSLTIPAFTTITALEPHTATIEMIGGSAIMFQSANTQNEIFFKDLNLVVSSNAINRVFWKLPGIDGADNLQWMTTFGIYNCRINSLAQDFIYFNEPGPAFYAEGNDVRGTYDVFRMAEHRKAVFVDNDIETYSNGQNYDIGEPTPIVFGSTGNLVYPEQNYFIFGNRLSSIANALPGDTQGHAAAIQIRNPLSGNANMIIRGNTLKAVVTGGSDPAGSIGVKVSGDFVGSKSPYIEVSDNDLYVTNAGSGPAYLYSSGNGYSITVSNNHILPGSTSSVGQNVNSIIVQTLAGNVGIGTSTPYARLEVWGPDSAATTSALTIANNASTTVFSVYDNGNATYSGSIFQSSDYRLKTNIISLDASSSLAAIAGLNPVSYTRIDQPGGGTNLGFIAQAVQQIFPELVSTTSSTALTPNGTLTLNYIGLIAPIVEAIKGLAAEVTSLVATVAGFAQSFTSQNITASQHLCVGSTCITESQLKALLQNNGQQGDVQTAGAITTITDVSTSTPFCTLKASQTSVTPSNRVVLSWNFPDAGTFSIDQGIGPVSPALSGTTTSKAIDADTTFTGTAVSDTGETTTCATSVSVTSAPPPPHSSNLSTSTPPAIITNVATSTATST